jgi:hypothetical protein
MKQHNLQLALRAQRVQAARHASGPRIDPVKLAVQHSSRLSAKEVDAELKPMQAAFAAMRQAHGTKLDWLLLCTAINHARVVSDMGTVKVPRIHLDAAEAVLTAIESQSLQPDGSWHPSPLRHHELDALADLLRIYGVMVREVYRNEWQEVQRRAIARVESAGGEVLTVVGVTP